MLEQEGHGVDEVSGSVTTVVLSVDLRTICLKTKTGCISMER